MRLSQFFLPILREEPGEAKIASHRLMLRAGMIRQVTSGIYNWLPLGLMVLRNIENIIRQELNNIGCLEVIMPLIQPASLWQESGRYDDYGKEMLRIHDRHETELLYGPTAEEIVTDIIRQNINSYKQLPKILYQINWKFRDEIRPRFGVIRGREFLMKDAYSFDLSKEEAQNTYFKIFAAYQHIFTRMGLKSIAVKADSGPIGGELSHEFHILAETGESEIYYDKILDSKDDWKPEELMQIYAVADEQYDPSAFPEERLAKKRGIEIGHVFYLGQKYSSALNAKVTMADGTMQALEMGCYGIGVSRLVAAAIEANHDQYGVIWPKAIAPFQIAIINLRPQDAHCRQVADNLYQELDSVLLDDTEASVGSKFATIDLIGIPIQIIIGPKGLEEDIIEYKIRSSGEKGRIKLNEAKEAIAGLLEKVK